MRPIEVANQEFPKQTWGGYNIQSVKTFLGLVANEMEKLTNHLSNLEMQGENLKREAGRALREENAIARVMLDAETRAQRVREEAEEDARLTRETAVREAERLRLGARAECDAMLVEARSELRRAESRIYQLRKVLVETAGQAQGALTGALTVIESIRVLDQSLPDLESSLEAPEATMESRPPALQLADLQRFPSPDEPTNS